MKIRHSLLSVLFVLLLQACNTTKYVPDGEYLLEKVQITTDSKDLKRDDLKDYLRQTPNASVFGLFKVRLGVYNLAGKDTTKWWNRMWKRIGDEPIIYSPTLTHLSVQQIQRVVENKGYFNAKVKVDTVSKGKKIALNYVVKSNKPYLLRDYSFDLRNVPLTEIAADTSRSLIRSNMLFDVDVLDDERERITSRFRQSGYYNFNKDFLTYTVDSSLNSHQIDVKLELRDYLKNANDSISNLIFQKYNIRKVLFYTTDNAVLGLDMQNNEKTDTTCFRDFMLISTGEKIIKLDALVQNTFINPNTLYSDRAVERTYSALNSLGPIKYININFKNSGTDSLDCHIYIVPAKALSLSTELEATYTDGFWGGAWNINALHRNIFNGAETLSLQTRVALEWQKDVLAKELGAQVGLKFPRFVFPVGSYDFKRNIHANTEYTSSFSYQIRPQEFETTNVGAGMKYSWSRRRQQHSIDLFDLSYVYFPTIDESFRNNFLTTGIFNPYNYENHFIMRSGYTGTSTNFNTNRPMQNHSTMRYSIEIAGNLLYGLNRLLGSEPSPDGSYRLFNIRYAQYVKGEYNLSHHQIIDKDNRFVYRAGVGLGIPYANADVIPYERRFYSGGANSVRGWNESTLGPGVYKRIDGKRRDYNQVGDIKLDLNMEYRAKMFWLLEGALFLDAGNIWTIKKYDETGDEGAFGFDTFMKQIAISYGAGIRFDFSFFIARFDMGIKLFDPVQSRREQWRVKPNWSDCAFHIAIGYPF
jgi:outer membrane protein assembly factor BamA